MGTYSNAHGAETYRRWNAVLFLQILANTLYKCDVRVLETATAPYIKYLVGDKVIHTACIPNVA